MITIEGKPPHVYYEGATFTVEWYVDPAGRMKAKDYYEALTLEDRKRLDDLVSYMADSPFGTRLPKSLYNLENAENQIYAFKPRDHRFFDFMTMGARIIIVDAYRKHSQRMAKKDQYVLKAAIEARKNYLERVAKGTYYDRLA
jgi:hypothetical protein